MGTGFRGDFRPALPLLVVNACAVAITAPSSPVVIVAALVLASAGAATFWLMYRRARRTDNEQPRVLHQRDR